VRAVFSDCAGASLEQFATHIDVRANQTEFHVSRLAVTSAPFPHVAKNSSSFDSSRICRPKFTLADLTRAKGKRDQPGEIIN